MKIVKSDARVEVKKGKTIMEKMKNVMRPTYDLLPFKKVASKTKTGIKTKM